MSAIALVARCPVTVRQALAGDYAFVDKLQRVHGKALGFMRKAALEGKIKLGEVLIAEDETGAPIGYCIASYRYLKRDELGVVYQMNISPGTQRKLVGATLLKAVFERAPYGCKLFCCWCRQDLDANHFWESMGFFPLAFRAGAQGKSVHIFWQRRIREGDTQTPYWFPSKTDGGMMREDRLVLPIPPGVHWKDPMPVLVPEVQSKGGLGILPEDLRSAHSSGAADRRGRSGETPKPRKEVKRPAIARLGGVSFTPTVVAKARPEKKKREKVKADPALIAKARELRDRYLERFNCGLILPSAKYDVAKAIDAAPIALPLLEQKAA